MLTLLSLTWRSEDIEKYESQVNESNVSNLALGILPKCMTKSQGQVSDKLKFIEEIRLKSGPSCKILVKLII